MSYNIKRYSPKHIRRAAQHASGAPRATVLSKPARFAGTEARSQVNMWVIPVQRGRRVTNIYPFIFTGWRFRLCTPMGGWDPPVITKWRGKHMESWVTISRLMFILLFITRFEFLFTSGRYFIHLLPSGRLYALSWMMARIKCPVINLALFPLTLPPTLNPPRGHGVGFQTLSPTPSSGTRI